MPSKRKFFKTVIQVEILSEDTPFTSLDLEEVSAAITVGDCSGIVKHISTTGLTGTEAAKELQGQASDPEFFCLDEDGNDLES